MTAMTRRHRPLAVLLCVAALAGCDYEKNAFQDITGPAPSAGIRFFNFGVNAPGVNFYAGDTRVTAVGTATCSTEPIPEACLTTGMESTSGVAYGGAAAGGLYAGIAPGQYTFSGRIAGTTDKGLAISSLQVAIADGKKYSYYQSGVYNTTTKTVEAFVVEDNIPAFNFDVAYVRFVHAIFNANPMTLYATGTTPALAEAAVGGTVAYKSAGAFVGLTPGVYNLATRYVGSSTTVISRTAVTLSPGRVYTITARGDITVASTSACAAANVTCMDQSINR